MEDLIKLALKFPHFLTQGLILSSAFPIYFTNHYFYLFIGCRGIEPKQSFKHLCVLMKFIRHRKSIYRILLCGIEVFFDFVGLAL
jgi:hypothetical protein